MAGMQLAPFTRRQALYPEHPTPSPRLHNISPSLGGVPVSIYGRRRTVPDTYVNLSGSTAHLGRYQGLDQRGMGMGIAPLRRMAVHGHGMPPTMGYYAPSEDGVLVKGGVYEVPCSTAVQHGIGHGHGHGHMGYAGCGGCFYGASGGAGSSSSSTSPPSPSNSSSSSSSPSKKESGSSSGSGSGKSKPEYDFKTKDIFIRGKVYAIRASYLAESPKFEAELMKYVDKKKEELVPRKVVEMLIRYVNEEVYENSSFVDEVTVCVLAGCVGAKSVVEYSLTNLKEAIKKHEIPTPHLSQIVVMIMCSEKVDDKLKDWLKSYFKKPGERGDRLHRLNMCPEWEVAIFDKPEAATRLGRLLEIRPSCDEGEWRIM